MSKKGDTIRSHLDKLIQWHIDKYNALPERIYVFARQWDVLVKERGTLFDGTYRGVEIRPTEDNIYTGKANF